MPREMKESGIEWIGKIPIDWDLRRLQYSLNEIVEKNNPIQTTNVLSLVKDKGIMPYEEKGNQGNKAKEDPSEYKIAYPNTLVVNSMNILIGSVGISNYFGCVSPVYYVFKETDKSDLRYVNYIFQTREFQKELRKYAKGILEIRLRVSSQDIFKRDIPFPDKTEQQKIANFLDEKVSEIDKVIAKTKESIEEDKKLKQAIITSTVTRGLSKKGGLKVSGLEWVDLIPSDWSIQKTSRYFKLSKGLPITKDNLKESGIPVVSYGQIHAKWNSGTRMHEELKRYVDISYANDYPQCKVPIGSIIMADTSEDLDGCGNAAYNDICDNLYAGYHTITLTSSEENNKYYSYLFKTSAWRSQIRQRASGVKLFSVTQKILKETTILVPPIETQIEISNYLDEKCNNIDSIILAKESICKELEQYKKSLIYEYVTGKKEVR